jgi:uncharacterized membrane protein
MSETEIIDRHFALACKAVATLNNLLTRQPICKPDGTLVISSTPLHPFSSVSRQKPMSHNSISFLATSSGYPADWSDWRFWVFLAALFAFYYAFKSWSSKRRRRALSQLAPSMNFTWLDTMPETPRGVAFLRPGLGGKLSNAMTGSEAGCKVTIFDFEYETGISARTERTHAQTIAAFRSAQSVLPAFQFGPESVMRKMSTVGSARQFKFETALPSVPAPAGHYVLRTQEQTAAHTLFDSETLKYFNDLGLQHKPWFLEGNQEWLLIWAHNSIVPPQNYPRFLQQTSSIAAMVLGCAKEKRTTTPQIAGQATVGQSVGGGAAPAAATTGVTENLAGAFAYVTFLPAVWFLLFEPFNKNPFVRFHAFQSIFLTVALFVVSFASALLSSAFGWTGIVISPLVGLAAIGLWIFLIFKAFQGRAFKLPIIGDLAEQRANNA